MVDLAGPACSDWARSQHLDPVGTAGVYQGFLLVETPLPWPSDITDLPELAEISELAAAAGARVQAVFPSLWPEGSRHPGPSSNGADAEGGREGLRRLVYYRSARPGWAAPLVRTEAHVATAEMTKAVAGLLAGAPTAGGGDAHGGADSADGEAPTDIVELLVCTHGRRDTCCGSRGTELFAELLEALAPAPGSPGMGRGQHPRMRLWRTSHTGGHRFAPTAVVLPYATMWAWADVDLLLQVTSGGPTLGDTLARYRGCAVLGPAPHQAVERAVLAEVGPSLLSTPRRSVNGPDKLVRLETEGLGNWEAMVRPGRRVPQPDCHTPPGQASKFGVEWVVEGLRQVVTA